MRLYDLSPQCYNDGTCTFIITDEYSSVAVKAALRTMQNNKCCFSEVKFTADHAHVEHFRPKKRLEVVDSKTKMFPGYYWLAYEWSNLFFCKSRINTSNKRNYFPLQDETQRNRNHHDQNVEVSLLIDPAAENPRTHIRFHRDEPFFITGKGKINIVLLGLRHNDLIEPRRTRLLHLEALRDSTDLLVASGIPKSDPLINKNISLLKEAMSPESEFSSMAIDLLSNWPQLQ